MGIECDNKAPSFMLVSLLNILVTKKKAQETFLCSVLQNEVRWLTEFYKYVKRRKGNRESVLTIKDHNGKLITDPIEKADSLNSYYASIQLRTS
jgi:hypothetical protein